VIKIYFSEEILEDEGVQPMRSVTVKNDLDSHLSGLIHLLGEPQFDLVDDLGLPATVNAEDTVQIKHGDNSLDLHVVLNLLPVHLVERALDPVLNHHLHVQFVVL